MPAKKFIQRVAGRFRELAGVVVSTGAANDGDLVALDASGKLDVSLLPAGVGVNTQAGTATEALAANDLVNFHAGGVRKADATTEGREAHGFVKAAVANAATATVYLPGDTISGLTGLTQGARYYLSTTPGGFTLTEPSGVAGQVGQLIGVASSATSIVFEPEEPVTKAA